MPRYRTWALLACLALATSACTSTGTPAEPSPGDEADGASYLFVQTCTAGALDGNTLKLSNVGPTLYFTDRPARVEGHVRTPWLLAQWDKGANSSASDPPNAVLSVFGGDEVANMTVVLTEPRLVGNDLYYTIETTDGSVPASFGEASLFIDNFRGGARRGSMHRSEVRHGSYYHRSPRRRRIVDEDDGQQFTDLGHTGPPPPHLGL